MKKEFIEMPIGQIEVQGELRRNLGDMVTLENSIRKLGLLNPLIVDCQNVLICGERRLKACRSIGLQIVSVFKLDIDRNSMAALDIQSDLNLCREPFSNDDLNRMIDKKKAQISPPSHRESGGFFGRIRKTMSSS